MAEPTLQEKVEILWREYQERLQSEKEFAGKIEVPITKPS
jgi:hypothetical protein